MGVCNLSQIFLGNLKSAYLGYWIGAKFAGQGYMTEAIDLMLSHAFETLRLHRIEANIQPENASSIAVVSRLGFRRRKRDERKHGGERRSGAHKKAVAEPHGDKGSRV